MKLFDSSRLSSCYFSLLTAHFRSNILANKHIRFAKDSGLENLFQVVYHKEIKARIKAIVVHLSTQYLRQK